MERNAVWPDASDGVITCRYWAYNSVLKNLTHSVQTPVWRSPQAHHRHPWIKVVLVLGLLAWATYFQALLQWYNRDTSNTKPADGAFTSALPTDVAMVVDAGLRKHVEYFAADRNLPVSTRRYEPTRTDRVDRDDSTVQVLTVTLCHVNATV
jgi:hypothetical protein